MPSTMRLPRTGLLAAAALLALSAAGVVSASAAVLPAASERTSSSFVAGTQLPTLALEESPAE